MRVLSGVSPAKNEGRKQEYEGRLARTIEELLEKTVGFGNVRATVTADFNFDRITSKQTDYDPERQVVRSTQTIEQARNQTETENEAVTVGQALPDGAPGGGERATANANENRTEETTNFAIAKTVTNKVESGYKIEACPRCRSGKRYRRFRR